MTGFTEMEETLSRLVAAALRDGVPEQAFGLGGMRTVGPLVTLQVENGRAVYRTNGTPGATLGDCSAEARTAILHIWRAFVETPASR